MPGSGYNHAAPWDSPLNLLRALRTVSRVMPIVMALKHGWYQNILVPARPLGGQPKIRAGHPANMGGRTPVFRWVPHIGTTSCSHPIRWKRFFFLLGAWVRCRVPSSQHKHFRYLPGCNEAPTVLYEIGNVQACPVRLTGSAADRATLGRRAAFLSSAFGLDSPERLRKPRVNFSCPIAWDTRLPCLARFEPFFSAAVMRQAAVVS